MTGGLFGATLKRWPGSLEGGRGWETVGQLLTPKGSQTDIPRAPLQRHTAGPFCNLGLCVEPTTCQVACGALVCTRSLNVKLR
ncbi:hypothetical protein GN956_G16439 [Arapaima gigas]